MGQRGIADRMKPSIRFATPQDAEVIWRLIRDLAVYEREPDAVEATPDSLCEQMQASVPPFECLIAQSADEVVGFALFFHNYSTWRGRRGLYLEDLFVPTEHRGKGIGGALLARLAAIAVERGCGRMEWAVLNWNSPAIKVYEGLGAQPMKDWTTWRLTGEPLAQLAGKIPSDKAET